MARACGSIKVFVLDFFIGLAIFVPLFILGFSILPRYISWLGSPYPLWFATLMGVLAFLLSKLIDKFLLKKRNR